jgi:hypothetical protein
VLSLGDIKLLQCLGKEVPLNIRDKVELIGTTRSDIDVEIVLDGDERRSRLIEVIQDQKLGCVKVPCLSKRWLLSLPSTEGNLSCTDLSGRDVHVREEQMNKSTARFRKNSKEVDSATKGELERYRDVYLAKFRPRIDAGQTYRTSDTNGRYTVTFLYTCEVYGWRGKRSAASEDTGIARKPRLKAVSRDQELPLGEITGSAAEDDDDAAWWAKAWEDAQATSSSLPDLTTSDTSATHPPLDLDEL